MYKVLYINYLFKAFYQSDLVLFDVCCWLLFHGVGCRLVEFGVGWCWLLVSGDDDGILLLLCVYNCWYLGARVGDEAFDLHSVSWSGKRSLPQALHKWVDHRHGDLTPLFHLVKDLNQSEFIN